ncbi:MAG: FecR family protein [Pseudobdellovibrionaceae bacterium]
MQNIRTILSIRYFVITFITSLFFSMTTYADAMHGIFMVVKGEVSVKSANQQKPKVKVGDKVFPGDVVECGADGRAKIVMSDRNVINISPDTKLEIQKYENNGTSKNVELNLLQGKVRNNVEQKYDGEKNKFLVKTPTAVAGVRGTQFFTSFDPGTRITSVVTLRGAVTLAPANVTNGNAKPVVVKKGESTSMAPGSNPEPPKAMPKEELKKIDQESTASASPSKQDSPKEVAKSENSKSDSKNSDSKDSRSPASMTESSASSNSSSNSSSSSSTNSSSSNSSSSTASPGSSTGNSAPIKAPTMVETGDMDAGQFKEIRTPAAEVSAPKAPPPTLVNTVLPPPPPTSLINNIINNGNSGKAHIIISPVPQ